MPSIEYAGMKVTGGKVFAILTLLGALGSGAWATFTFYQDYLTMKEKILEYTEPDLSGFDKKIALIESETQAQMEIVVQKVDGLKGELDIVLEEINLMLDGVEESFRDLGRDFNTQYFLKANCEKIN